MFLPILLFVLLSTLTAETPSSTSLAPFNKNGTADKKNSFGTAKLSRKKRFLIFPEGSSLQLVYCLTIPSVAMADFFVFGWTAAIAWELPNKPYIGVHKKKDKKEDEMPEVMHDEDHSHSRIDSPIGGKTKFYYTKNKSPYSTLNKLGIKIPPSTYSTILQMLNKNLGNPNSYGGSYYKNKIHFADRVAMYHDPAYREVHRRTRRDLYPKIEKFLTMQQKDGKACLLKAICEVTKLPKGKEKGSFMQELIRVLFRVKEFQHPNDQKDKYDEAANENHNCDEMYSTCDSSIFSLF